MACARTDATCARAYSSLGLVERPRRNICMHNQTMTGDCVRSIHHYGGERAPRIGAKRGDLFTTGDGEPVLAEKCM